MQIEPAVDHRQLKTIESQSDLVVVGGGLAGVCCAITAARAGISVTLIEDRPVLGGNSSSEVRLWVLGATAHMGNNNRWAREGGVNDEILVENMYRNREGNSLIFDTILLEKVVEEPKITLLLNTAVYEVEKADADTIAGVTAFCSQNSTRYVVRSSLFCDASGDGVVGFLAGAAFRMGAESQAEFGEKFAPDDAYGELLGHSIYFYSKDVGTPVRFVPPSFALDDITVVPRYRHFNTATDGCRLWWIEYGGRLDTVHETETIKWELWKVVYGVWDYIKNSGEFPEAENLTLEWVGHIPGKRESRRFEGPYMLTQQDIVEQRHFDNAVSFGGWSIDLHPADGVYSERPGCDQWHAKGVYQIPYGCLYSKNVRNLFLAGRIISASHVAFGTTRVMATCANSAQAVAMAAVLCHRDGLLPADISDPTRMAELQRDLMRRGQHIPGFALNDPDNLAATAKISASSCLTLGSLPDDGPPVALDRSRAQMLPLDAGPVPAVTFTVDVAEPTTLSLELRTSSRFDNQTPDVLLGSKSMILDAGANQQIVVDFDASLDGAKQAFYCLMANDHVSVHTSELRITGVLSLVFRHTQQPDRNIGVEVFDFWCPERRPDGRNMAIAVDPLIALFSPEQVVSGVDRPTSGPNAWVAAMEDGHPTISLEWTDNQTIARVELAFDVDFDHPMESALFGHPEAAMPFCVKHYRICDDHEQLVAEVIDNHQGRNTVVFDQPLSTKRLSVHLLETHGNAPAALFGLRCYAGR
jgi:hypothetical protein